MFVEFCHPFLLDFGVPKKLTMVRAVLSLICLFLVIWWLLDHGTHSHHLVNIQEIDGDRKEESEEEEEVKSKERQSHLT